MRQFKLCRLCVSMIQGLIPCSMYMEYRTICYYPGNTHKPYGTKIQFIIVIAGSLFCVIMFFPQLFHV